MIVPKIDVNIVCVLADGSFSIGWIIFFLLINIFMVVLNLSGSDCTGNLKRSWRSQFGKWLGLHRRLGCQSRNIYMRIAGRIEPEAHAKRQLNLKP